MDADTKKRDPGCTCHQEEGDSECVIHDPPTCKRCGCEYTMKWPDTEPTKYCNACAHAVVEAAEARAEKAEALLHKADGMANEVNILTTENRALTSELAEARKQLGDVTTKLELLEHEHRGALSDLKWCIPLAEDMASEDDDDFEEWQEIKERWLEGGAFGAGEAK